ncbi:protein of unknown function [Pseudobutyrivibrio sp. OR37]|uniref:DUF1848 domain-containing protein n=1 Tax=Pseudobutyrivibrio sp. OR37 TaxID=1798186 RepID=UPI0008E09A65|nr:DUF1848 domain-containing protein [Pseudobutyrivibrio sp. OR37]SFH57241.1 protein of unknown function [Pseudobutyrivibrio sp. OR37]
MIINTGQRTDIPAFFPEWLANRLKEGYVCVRNPYNPSSVNKYILNPQVVDAIGFCTKNPAPFFPYLDLVKDYGQYWYVTITPYGKDIEPGVPDKNEVMESFKFLSNTVGVHRIGWRYDPIFVNDKYTVDFHIEAFTKMAENLKGYTNHVVISFIDIYEKVKRNFPEARPVSASDKVRLGQEFVKIAAANNMVVKPCAEGDFLEKYGADCSGCMTVAMYEKALDAHLKVPKSNVKPARADCACYLGADIGAYDTCRHFCRYCYANSDLELVRLNEKRHDVNSPFLIGGFREGDEIHETVQKSWIDGQMNIFDFI